MWNLNLSLCCIVCVLCSSIQFGYNSVSLNSVSPFVKRFLENESFMVKEYYENLALFKLNEKYLIGNETLFNEVYKSRKLLN